MKKTSTHEQKSLFESISQKDQKVLRDLETIWDKSASYQPKVKFDKEAAYNKFMKAIDAEPAPVQTSPNVGKVLLRSAIAIGIAALVYFAYLQMFSFKTIKTSDNIEFAMLDDGTGVWLNKHSELKYPNSFASDSRNVSLKGEAFFEVAKDADRPFSVDLSKENVVTVLGTKFNINDRFDSKVEVSVTEGKVNLKNEKRQDLTIDLAKGDKGIINVASKTVQKENINTNVLAWREDKLDFNATSLTTIIEELGIFYGVQFKFDNANTECTYTTSVNRDQTIDQTISIISKSFSGIKITKADQYLYYVQGTCK
jgi:ferric-dicitrate binding protein FerR (iron transport regulator)